LREQMRFEIKALQRRVNITTIYVTHDQGEALAISDQIAVMHGGKLIEVGDPHQLYSKPKRKFTATFLGLTNLINGKVIDTGRDSELSRLETKFGTLRFAPAEPFEIGAEVVISIRPENVSVDKEPPASSENVVEGMVHDAVFMGDAYHCQVTVGDQLIRIHTHPMNAVPVGQKVYLTFDPQSCNGLPAGDTEGMDDSMLGD
jgi:iron(III) transport system ATP-binding protein